MKTPKQVRRWMRRQTWWRSFRTLAWMEENRSLRDKLRTLTGHGGLHTVAEAFNGFETLQGGAFWADVSAEFMCWYNKD